MHLKYYAEQETERKSHVNHSLNKRKSRYQVSNATEMTTEELIDAIRDKIQETLVFNSR